ncbi:MAG: gamma-glutamyl-gamma-aminobutyrate hydrolase family protein [Chloroflexi bacterium]|nr:gamma-glutamyl-gamma-aminobutyrate hydrolase family protein [Chloroflexota bacterium]
MKPIIGVTTYNGMNAGGYPAVLLLRAYVQAVVQAGAVPLLIPTELPEADYWLSVARRVDGLLFTGGGDIATDRYGGMEHPRVADVDERRDLLEFQLMEIAARDGIPFLGICRGCQVLNVALGGTLFSHIESQMAGAVKHDYYPNLPRDLLAHRVAVKGSSRLAGILGGDEQQVNSLHHQGLEKLGDGLEPVAHAPDGLTEAVELSGHPFGLGVQWHPEWLTAYRPMRRIFESLVEVAAHATPARSEIP